MKEVIISFDEKGLEGVVAVGAYLSDAAKRIGIKIEGDCLDPTTEHDCVIKIGEGRDLLSEPTQSEMEQLSSEARSNGERLACQTIIEKPGEITIMSVKEKQKDPKAEQTAEGYKKEFESLPLEKKIASLMELEVIALGETVSYVLNSPYKAVGKVMDVMAEFGLNLERKEEAAKRPEEHRKTQNASNKKEKDEHKSSSTTKKKAAKPVEQPPHKETTGSDGDKEKDG